MIHFTTYRLLTSSYGARAGQALVTVSAERGQWQHHCTSFVYPHIKTSTHATTILANKEPATSKQHYTCGCEQVIDIGCKGAHESGWIRQIGNVD